jgi:hypothetical protein
VSAQQFVLPFPAYCNVEPQYAVTKNVRFALPAAQAFCGSPGTISVLLALAPRVLSGFGGSMTGTGIGREFFNHNSGKMSRNTSISHPPHRLQPFSRLQNPPSRSRPLATFTTLKAERIRHHESPGTPCRRAQRSETRPQSRQQEELRLKNERHDMKKQTHYWEVLKKDAETCFRIVQNISQTRKAAAAEDSGFEAQYNAELAKHGLQPDFCRGTAAAA